MSESADFSIASDGDGAGAAAAAPPQVPPQQAEEPTRRSTGFPATEPTESRSVAEEAGMTVDVAEHAVADAEPAPPTGAMHEQHASSVLVATNQVIATSLLPGAWGGEAGAQALGDATLALRQVAPDQLDAATVREMEEKVVSQIAEMQESQELLRAKAQQMREKADRIDGLVATGTALVTPAIADQKKMLEVLRGLIAAKKASAAAAAAAAAPTEVISRDAQL